jgi:hypothetical protein
VNILIYKCVFNFAIIKIILVKSKINVKLFIF